VSALTEELLKKVNKIYGILSTSTPISGSVDVIDRAARLLGIVYGSQGQQILQRASTYDLLAALRYQGSEIDPRSIRTLASTDIVTAYGSQAQALLQRASTYDLEVQLRTAGTEYDARQIRTLTSSDVVSVNNFANPLPTLVQYPSGTTIDPRSIRALTSSDIVTSLINYPSGTLIDPRSIRALTSSDAITVYGSQSQALQQRATSYEALVTIRQSGSELSASNPIFASIVYSGGVIDPRSIRTLTSSDIVTANNATRGNLLVEPERYDLTVYGVAVTVGTGGTPVQVGSIAAGSGTKIKIYDFSIAHAVANSLVYLYFGTSSTPTTRIFGYGESANITGAAFTLHKSLPNPKCSNNSDDIWLYASVAGTYYVELGYVIE
jgi:hypothetical protein